MEIVISGTFDEVFASSLRVQKIVKDRKETGWHMFQQDEEWKYITRNDGNVCPTCLGFTGGWMGAEIPPYFEHWSKEHPLFFLEKNEVYPNTHESYPAVTRGICRCILEWIDYMFVLGERLGIEIWSVI